VMFICSVNFSFLLIYVYCIVDKELLIVKLYMLLGPLQHILFLGYVSVTVLYF
jgi:hypothetical protein